MADGCAGSMTARRDAIGRTAARGDSVTGWARGDGWRLRGAGMGGMCSDTELRGRG